MRDHQAIVGKERELNIRPRGQNAYNKMTNIERVLVKSVVSFMG